MVPQSPMYRKRRPKLGPTKNELKVGRSETEERRKTQAGTLQERFPQVTQLRIGYRMETPSGAILEQSERTIGPTEPLLLDVACQGGCGNGMFLLNDALETVLAALKETHEGMGICQAASYNDPKLPCSTKLFYSISVQY